jgi:hypothetical protein
MCASDEFHFIPRAERARLYYDKIENMDASIIEEIIYTIKEYKVDFENYSDNVYRGSPNDDFEILIDGELLLSSACALLIELEKKRSWLYNPLLYLKIAFIGLDHSLTKPAFDLRERADRASYRLFEIPRLLQQAMENIRFIPRPYLHPTCWMIRDCERYITEIGERISFLHSGNNSEGIEKVLTALAVMREFVEKTPIEEKIGTGFDKYFPPSLGRYDDTEALEDTLKNHFRTVRNKDEIYEIGVAEWKYNLERLNTCRKAIDIEKTWHELYYGDVPSDIENRDTISLYRREFLQLHDFFNKNGFGDMNFNTSLEICETPTYMRSVRGSASFSAGFSNDKREKDIFYITTHIPEKMSTQERNLLKKQLHREYKFLSAHETYPGHHLLDCFRRSLTNPIQRQVESPLFYEGWSYYGESLLGEYGYVKNPMDHLIDAKRGLWRAARCQIDIGLTTGKIKRSDAEELLIRAGFTGEEAAGQIERFQLNPGYQLCYSLGRYEILNLKAKYCTVMGTEKFHRKLLEKGQLPFHLVERKLEREV